jgi:peptidoglycan/LPS O-acetylase OafA/YrhL
MAAAPQPLSPQAQGDRPSLLPRLTSLRAFAALAVFAYHSQLYGFASPDSPAALGFAGVGFFFILSGLVLTYAMSEPLATRTFFERRAIRILPSHLAVLAVAVFISVPSAKGIPALFASAPLLQAWSPDPFVVWSYNSVAWSLSCEAMFYLAFPFVVARLQRLRQTRRLQLAVGAFAVSGAFIFASEWLGAASRQWAYSNPAVRFHEFLIGIAIGLALREGWRPALTARAAAAIMIALATLAWLYLRADWPMAEAFPNVILTLGYVAVLLAAVRADLAGRLGWLAHPVLMYAGTVSFAFYLVHELVLVNLQRHTSLSGAAGAAAAFALACGCAVVLHHAVEEPAQQLFKRRRALARAAGAA